MISLKETVIKYDTAQKYLHKNVAYDVKILVLKMNAFV